MKTETQKLMEEVIFELEKLKKRTSKVLRQVRKMGLELEVEENEYTKINAQKHIEQINNKLLND